MYAASFAATCASKSFDGTVEAFGPRAEVMARFTPRTGAGQMRAQNVIPLTLPVTGGESESPGGAS